MSKDKSVRTEKLKKCPERKDEKSSGTCSDSALDCDRNIDYRILERRRNP